MSDGKMFGLARRLGLARSTDYDDPTICEVVTGKTAALHAAARIDSLVPAELLLPTLLAVATSGNRVLDFGGGAGLHHLVASRAFPDRALRWAVVELPAMVESASRFENDQLRFFTSIAAAADWLGKVDLLHSNGALQSTQEPEQVLADLLALSPVAAFWARMLVADERRIEIQTAPLSAHGPGPAPADLRDRPITHRAVHMKRAAFLAAHSTYRLVLEGAGLFWFTRLSSAP